MFPVINIGPLALPAPGLILLAGFWLGLELTERHAPRFCAHPGTLYNLTLVGAVAGLLGARLVYAIRAPGAFMENPLALLAPRPQMLDVTGGLLVGLLAALIYAWRKRLAAGPTLDSAATLLAVFAVALGLANLASGDAFGAPAQVPWAVELWGAQRHPSQVYETLAAVLALVLVWPGGAVARYSERRGGNGMRFWVFLAFSATARLFLETFRGDSTLLLNSFRQEQVIAWLVLAISLWQIGRRFGPP
jgi:phosphatidylglycerol---prolipoprotein diacylglyceryl transferase